MLALYLACLFFGGILLALSLFAGGDADMDADIDGDIGGDVDASADAEVDGATSGQGIVAAARFLSFRNVVFFAAFFGLTGVLFTFLQINSVITAGTALVIGLAAGASVHHLMDFMRQSESGEAESLDRLEGSYAEVVVGMAGSRPGKIAVKAGDRTHQLVASIHEAAEAIEFRTGDTVTIVRIENGIARVAESTFVK
jgi:hypothetical protein